MCVCVWGRGGRQVERPGGVHVNTLRFDAGARRGKNHACLAATMPSEARCYGGFDFLVDLLHTIRSKSSIAISQIKKKISQNYWKISLRAPSTHVTPIKDSNSGSGGDGKEAENVDALVLVSCARPETLPDEVTKSC